MTKREKVLAFAVGSLVGLMGFLYMLNKATQAFTKRSNQLLVLDSQIAKQKRTITFGTLAQRELKDQLHKSLPSDRSLARSWYQAWLLDLADNKVKFQGVQVNPRVARAVKRSSSSSSSTGDDLYYEQSFLVSGKGNLEQLVEFMYHFYHADYLHRIRRVDMQPIDSNILSLSVTVEALALSDAPARQPLSETRVSRLVRSDLDEYVSTIAYRNPFGPANKGPSIAAIGTKSGPPNTELSFQVKASDPEKNKLSYSLEGTVPEGARINPTTGLFRWTPKEKGTFEVLVRVTDTGMPARSAEASLKLKVADAAVVKKAAEFDPATMAQVTGITETGTYRLLWISVHTEGRVLKLRVGDEIEVGTIKGTVAEIESSRAKIETEEGNVIVINLGKHLIEADAGG